MKSKSKILQSTSVISAVFWTAITFLVCGVSGRVLADTADTSSWYTFQPGSDPAPGEIGMQEWLEKPAGKHGRIVRKGDKLYYDGKEIKLWGINNTFAACSPDKILAEKRAAFYAKYGINSVRLHKYADGTGWAGIQSKDSFVEFDPGALDRMDYLVSKYKEHGIYVKLSSTFGVKLGPADRKYIPYMDEFGQFSGKKNRIRAGYGAIYLSNELQDLQIRQIVKILKHHNPHTGMTYAEDPAIVVVELFNEDSVLWFGTISSLQSYPTLRKLAAERFSDWLKAKYGSREGLVNAWGQEAIDSFKSEGFTGENLEKRNIVPAGNPWFYDPEQLADSQANKRQRLFDTMLFLYELQNEFYDKYVNAIRQTGYKGEILGSNWQAGRAFSHYYNLHSDYRVGLIDRHNYFGGGRKGKVNNATMLRIAGSGMLSAGMQQVLDRPFMLSEWIHVQPNEWGVEGPAIIGAYGMGLQGWDVSYMFQNSDTGGFSSRLGLQAWDVTVPQVLGIFPAVARQVLRGDVNESDLLATRYVHIPSLSKGKISFDDKISQQHDVKTFDSDKVPAQALAVARSVVQFTDAYRDTPPFDMTSYLSDEFLVSSTGQLRWKQGQSELDGFFTINTDATKAVVGFAPRQSFDLGCVTIEPDNEFAAIYVTSQERDKDISTSKKLLVVALARARNTGQRFSTEGTTMEQVGAAPMLLEPVKARITIKKPGNPNVHLLDHDGFMTEKTLLLKNGTFEINGVRDKTFYYLVKY